MSFIEVKNISKEYKTAIHKSGFSGYIQHLFHPQYNKFNAVNDISFSIEQGEIVGYLGENGAGKSTTIKMLTGLLTPSSGEIVINGIIPYKNRIKNNFQIGAIFGQKTQLWWDLPVMESFKLIGNLYKIPKEQFQKNLAWIVNELELESLLSKQVRNLSLGQKMKCEIAATFIHEPKIVYLDEPTIGLDVLVKENIRRFIKSVNKRFHTTIILTTHDISDVEELCERIILIDKGKKIYDGNIISFKERYSSDQSLIIYKKDSVSFLEKIVFPDSLKIIEENSRLIKLSYNTEKIKVMDIIHLFEQYYTIENIELSEIKFEDLLKEVYRGNIDVA